MKYINMAKELKGVISKLIKQTLSVKAVKDRMVTSVKKEFEEIEKEFLDMFENHPVTREINDGPHSSNISNTLGGVGNLFGYIGFVEGDDPLYGLRKTIASSDIRFAFGIKGLSVKIIIPSKEELFAITTMPWATGRSWAKGVERGIPGFGQFLAWEDKGSRSGAGVQTKSKIRGGRFRNISYLSPMLKWYEKEINNLQKRINR